MRAVLMLIAVFSLSVSSARADATLEARVLRLEAQVKALQESLKSAVHVDQVYNLRTGDGQPESCLSTSQGPSAAKADVLLVKCDDSNSGPRSWKITPAQR
jgi:hypothetical protein